MLVTALLLASPFLFDFNGYTFIGYMTSNSMNPVFNRGDLLIQSKIWDVYSQVDIGDVLVFKTPENGIVVHRVFDIIMGDKSTNTNPNYDILITTKGDDNTVINPFESTISSDRVIGKVVYVVKAPASYVVVFTPILMIFLFGFTQIYTRFVIKKTIDQKFMPSFLVKKHEVEVADD